jgi:ubiquitin C-terminal hydrolase
MFSHDSHRWRIVIFPQGYKTTGYVSVILLAVALESPHRVSFTVQTAGGAQTSTHTITHTFAPVCDAKQRVITEFIPLASIASYLDANELKLAFEITFQPPVRAGCVHYRQLTGHVGLRNQGATCYLNAMLQCLFHIPAFRRIVFAIDHDPDTDKSIPLSLQRLFALLQLSPIAPSTNSLTKSFGWGPIDVFMQHDVEEFLRVIIDNLETKMKHLSSADAIPNLLRGRTIDFTRCPEADYFSSRPQDFYEISCEVAGHACLQDSLRSSVSEDFLTGENQYSVEGRGKFDASIGSAFFELPPVLHVYLKRFMIGDDHRMVKILDRFEFPFELDMAPYLSDESSEETRAAATYELASVVVHFGTGGSGHYWAFCRPTPSRDWFKFNDAEVTRVSEADAIESNFGGPGILSSAYFLFYVNKSKMNEIMRPVTAGELPAHLVDYWRAYKLKHSSGPPLLHIPVVSERDYRRICAGFGFPTKPRAEGFVDLPPDMRFHECMRVLKEKGEIGPGAPASLFALGPGNYPVRRINPDCFVKQPLGSSARGIFVTNETPAVPDEVPILTGFYDPSIPTAPLRYARFFVLSPLQALAGVAAEIRALFGLPEDAALEAHHICAGRLTTELSLEVPLGRQDVGYGMVVFNLVEPNLLKTWPDEMLPFYRHLDLLPEFFCPSFADFCEATSVAASIVAQDYQDASQALVLEIPLVLPVSALVRCIAAIIELPQDCSILLFPRDGTNARPAEQPIPLAEDVALQLVLATRHVFFLVVRNVSQERLKTLTLFHADVYDADVNPIGHEQALMPPGFSGDDVLVNFRSRGIVPPDSNVRILQLNGASIAREVPGTEDLSVLPRARFRFELVPPDQVGLAENERVRVTITNNAVVPRAGCSGAPFLFRVAQGEPFAETKVRLMQRAKVEGTRVQFGYTNNSDAPKEHQFLVETDVLSELLVGEKTMVFVFLPDSVRQPSYWNRGFKIYE